MSGRRSGDTGFPCNQFGEQVPGSNEEIHSFCSDRYGITFPQYAKVDVNGENAIPLYKWLTSSCMFEGFSDTDVGHFMDDLLAKIDSDFRNNGAVKWNFTKFLVNKSGEVVARFEPTADWQTVVNAVKEAR